MRVFLLTLISFSTLLAMAQKTQKPPLHAKNWMAITGKPLSANAGAMIFQQGGNAVDATCAMLAAGCTMWDVLSWGGETQALIYNPKTKKVIAINALGVAPTGATADYFKGKGYNYPPEYGPLAAVTPGTPGGLCTMLAEYGTMSLKQVLAPAMQMAEGYPMEQETATSIERNKERIKQWPYSKNIFLPHAGQQWEAPEAGEIFKQTDLLQTLQKGRIGNKPSTRPMIVSIKATLQKNLFEAARSRAVSSPWKILPIGKCCRRSHSKQITGALMFTNCSNGHKDPRCYKP